MTTKPIETTKPAEKNVRSQQPTPEEMRAAYQAHTLAQMLYGHLASPPPAFYGGAADPRLTAGYGTAPGIPYGPGSWYWCGPGWPR
jgi:hypothetical protein